MTEDQDGLVVYVVADAAGVWFLHDTGTTLRVVHEFGSHGHEGTPGKLPAGATPADRDRDAFGRVVAEEMNGMVGKAAGFVLAAPAPVLHSIRSHLDKAATAKLLVGLSKDLGGIAAHDLRTHFDIPATGWVLPG